MTTEQTILWAECAAEMDAIPEAKEMFLKCANALRRTAEMDCSECIVTSGAYEASGQHIRDLLTAEEEGRLVVLQEPRKPLVWGDDDHDTVLCPYCGKDLMGIPYGERVVLQCPECGQYLDATMEKVLTRQEAEAALGGGEG